MYTKTILSAILATLAYLEAARAAPMPYASDTAIDRSSISSLPYDTMFKPVDLTTVDKRKTSAGSIAASALKNGGLSALESGAQDFLDDLTSSYDSSSSKRSLASSFFKEVPTFVEGLESFTDDDDDSSPSKRGWASLIDKAEPYVESAAESAAKSVGGAVGSEVASAGQSLASDAGLSRRKTNWGNVIESGASAGASTLGSGLGSTVADGFEAIASDAGINVEERSATFDAELPKRTGFWTEVEHGFEDMAPIAIGALADAKRAGIGRSFVDDFE
ncbi:hypothetical protein N0V93_000453 [Gnomoniopsis smithogilvyi]|uniref:Uncharacterized protein n=1 Tax=Gnomoniopsis smithogilvyi TaxID=1191159 RepID=A0A9W8Z074_9PEZI|nr:hypothetical protein N0V93_000453 [Gnomoniopsis smithogilvyi]